MAKFKVGDRVHIVAEGVSGRPTGTVTGYSYDNEFVRVKSDDDRSTGGWFESNLEHVAPAIAVGDTVRVAYEGQVSFTYGDGSLGVLDATGYYHSTTARAATLVEKAELEYTPGKLYRDADGGLIFRRGCADGATFWLALDSVHGDSYHLSDGVPARPIYEVMAVAVPSES